MSNKLYVVYNNTDLTAGCGGEYVYAITELEVTAERLAKGNGVQGSDCRIEEIEPVTQEGSFEKYIPISKVPLHRPTKEDVRAQNERDEKLAAKMVYEALLKKVKSLGLTDQEIEILKAH